VKEHIPVITSRWSRVPAAHRLLLALALALAVLACGWSVAQSQSSTTPAYSQADEHKPTTLPDRVVLTLEGDPSTTQSVTWRTDATVAVAQAQIAKAEEGPFFKDSAVNVVASRNVTQTANLGYATVFHTVRFTELEPATKYLYRLGDGTNWSEWYEFQTAAATPEPFSFVYYGDAQNDLQEHWSRVAREAFRDAPDARLWLHAGDLVNTANNDHEWGEWFRAGDWVNGMVPSFATPGNHEYSGGNLAQYWRSQFAFPDNGPQGTGPVYDAINGTAFYTDYQGVRFISLNSNTAAVSSALRQEFIDVQAAWLDQTLEANPNKWTVVTFHHPIFSNEPARNNPLQRAAWMPILEKHGVDLVLQGHDHSYGRGNLATGQSAQSPTGTLYVVSVSGPKMYGADESNWVENGAAVKKLLTDTQLYQVISVEGSKLRYQAKTATGRLHDAFTIRKNPEGKKTISEWEGSALGSPGVGSMINKLAGGTAEAFRTTAQTTGDIDRLNVYVEKRTSAKKLVAGIYADAGGRPGQLVTTSEEETVEVKGGWQTVMLPSIEVEKGTRYWIALLGLDGSLEMRDECCGDVGSEPSETSASKVLKQLPQNWARGGVFPTDGPVSAFAPITGP
jgi:hypothetical protein